jgi:hypothetical protein
MRNLGLEEFSFVSSYIKLVKGFMKGLIIGEMSELQSSVKKTGVRFVKTTKSRISETISSFLTYFIKSNLISLPFLKDFLPLRNFKNSPTDNEK